MASWINVSDISDFSLHNLPYGVFSTNGKDARIGVAIGDWVLDLQALVQGGVFDDIGFDVKTLGQPTLNAYAALEKRVHRAVRSTIQKLLEKDTKLGHVLKDNKPLHDRAFYPMTAVQMHLPMAIGDYSDFFVGLHHAKTCAGLIKPGQTIEQLCPCFWNMPIAYNGRSSSVVVSGTPFHRPVCQFLVDGKAQFGPSQKLDFEVEFAAFIGRGNDLGSPIDVNEAEDHIFGFVLLNDWSARDIQFYEATLMGPFNGKGFCTTISPWIVPLEALEPFRVAPKETPRELPDYLIEKRKKSAYDIPIRATLEVDSQKYRVADCNTNNVVFSFSQMIAHHTRAGVPLRTGDLIATGTLSGEGQEAAGCLFEKSMGGKEACDMMAADSSKAGVRRIWCEDNDVVTFTAQAKVPNGSGNVGFGTCSGKLLPAI